MKAPQGSCSSKREGQERWGHVTPEAETAYAKPRTTSTLGVISNKSFGVAFEGCPHPLGANEDSLTYFQARQWLIQICLQKISLETMYCSWLTDTLRCNGHFWFSLYFFRELTQLFWEFLFFPSRIFCSPVNGMWSFFAKYVIHTKMYYYENMVCHTT